MRQLNELEKEMEPYVIPKPESEREHVVTLNNDDLERLSKIGGGISLTTDKEVEEAIKKLIHALGDINLKKKK